MQLFSKICVLVVSIALIGCATSKTNNSPEDKEEDSYVKADQLSSYINTLPKLTVRNNQVVNVSTSTFRGTTQPLIELDGVRMGRNFARVLQTLDNNQMVSVEFLSSSRATIRYGEEGRNGVLIIKREGS